MIALFQKVKTAEIRQESKIIDSIDEGILIYLGIESKDDIDSIEKMIHKILYTEIIPDKKGLMTNTLSQIKQPVMLISQFTLCADLSGKKPTFLKAKSFLEAKIIHSNFITQLKLQLPTVVCGKFGEYLQISSINDGPTNFILNA
jgi:D-tyrosyl-tRNA(Tyr) deacylase